MVKKNQKLLTFYKCLVFSTVFQFCLHSQGQLQRYFAKKFLLNFLVLIIFRSLIFILLRIHEQPTQLLHLLPKKEKSFFFLSDDTDLLINNTGLFEVTEIFKQTTNVTFKSEILTGPFLKGEMLVKIKMVVFGLKIVHWRCRGYWSRGSGLVISVQDWH